MNTLHVHAWQVRPPDAVRLLIGLAPAGGFVMAGGPDAAACRDRADFGDDELQALADRWAWGRLFDQNREVRWRLEGDGASVVIAASDDPCALPPGASTLPGTERWKRVEHNELRPGRRLLWHDDPRLPWPPERPRSLDPGAPLAVEVQEYDGDEGPAWVRYVAIVEIEGQDGEART